MLTYEEVYEKMKEGDGALIGEDSANEVALAIDVVEKYKVAHAEPTSENHDAVVAAYTLWKDDYDKRPNKHQVQFADMVKQARDMDANPLTMLGWTWLYVFINGMDKETFEKEYARTEKACSQ